jgi:regulator of sirC expression with transglutaminase-like and TPR domain
MQATERFAALVQGPEDALVLDEATLLIAAHAHPELDLATQLARLDDLAERCATRTRDGVIAHLFRSEGFHGNDVDYYDPENSFLDAVLDRRTGIPITLSVVLIEVARRLGVPLVGVGAPGHFIVLDERSGAFVDPFNAGRILDHDDRTRLYGATPLEPVGPRAIVSRVLANLKGIYTQHGDLDALRWVVRLRVLFPDVPDEERAQLARLMAPMN